MQKVTLNTEFMAALSSSHSRKINKLCRFSVSSRRDSGGDEDDKYKTKGGETTWSPEE